MSNGKNVYANPARSTKFPFRSRSRVSRMTDSLLNKKEDRKYFVSVLGVHYCTHGARHFPPSPKLVVGHARSKSNFFANVSKNDDMPRRRQRACAARRLPPVCLGCFLIMHRASSRFCKFLTSGCQCIQCHSGNLTIDVSMTSCQKCAKPRALFMQHNFANEVARIRKEFSRRTVNDYAQMRQRRVSTGNQCTLCTY